MRMLAIAVLLSATAAHAEVPLPFADIPSASVAWYDVTGATSAEIRTSMDAARPRDPNDGSAVDGLTSWEFKVSWQTDERGTCVASLEDLHFSATVHVPRLVGANIPPEVRARFDRFLASLLAHEDGHVRNAWDHRGDVAAAINAAGCSGAARAAQRATNAIAAQDVAYDKATDHGRTTIVSF
ncbi:MAG: DUF922 domain-containing protein [Candidatus Andeanibacterium colombiense]|uniref:DUF922 domain-containing protein n=1 Tax=Candidatus Andeanibacterium colombiense TaxID=3121345 RepID=A0AAJ5X7T3_9SPHN|nr:MAG: DUF922 domain-containing protein [Sphingomonadaceae bacterium]